MNGSFRLDSLAGHAPIEQPPLTKGPNSGVESDLPKDWDGRRTGHGSTSAAREALRDEQRRLEMGGEDAEVRRRAVKVWLDQELSLGLAEELQLCRLYEAEAARRLVQQGQRRELPAHLDPHDLRQAGWGVVFPEGAKPGLREALQPLLAERRSSAGSLYKELSYRKGDSARRFLEDRLGQAPGVIDPRKAPYYLLLAGGPEDIPFEVQYQLSIGHAVGRIFFEDLRDYRRYASAVVQTEKGALEPPRRFTLFSVENEADLSTQRLKEHLVTPLAERLDGGIAPWQLDVWGADRAFRQDLSRLLGGEATPAVLLAACHGLRVPFGASEQQDLQGALVCQDQPFTADDVPSSTELRGLIAFLMACFGAGTPAGDSFPGGGSGRPRARQKILAPRPFLAALPQRLLSCGALAVLGHVDRGWTMSFSWLLQGQIQEAAANFEDVLRRLLTGERLGHALRPLYRRYAALAAHAAPSVERMLAGEEIDPQELQLLQMAINDARNFVLLGDPAVYASGRRVQSP
jgi:hypothetical protein